jgi:hypothetical protein
MALFRPNFYLGRRLEQSYKGTLGPGTLYYMAIVCDIFGHGLRLVERVEKKRTWEDVVGINVCLIA